MRRCGGAIPARSSATGSVTAAGPAARFRHGGGAVPWHTGGMAYQVWIIIFVAVVSVLFFIFINGGVGESLKQLGMVFKSPAAMTLLFFSVLLLLLIIFGGGVVRDGLTIREILIFSEPR